jgi:hypothetical protein
MIQMRWLVDGNERTLQYRQIVNKTISPNMPNIVYSTPWPQVPPVNQNWDWTDWTDVPEVVENVNPFRGKCSRCGLAFIGPTSYTCTEQDCPTGLGSST